MIEKFKNDIYNFELGVLLENCLPNTIDTTVYPSFQNGRASTFVITGDIEAMWLRDSTAQVWPYLFLLQTDGQLRQLIEGVIRRQLQCILVDPYANAFNQKPNGSPWLEDQTEMHPLVYERKWEVDSLCYAVRLVHGYWKATGDRSILDSEWSEAMHRIVETFIQQQRKQGAGPYRFQRAAFAASDSLPIEGRGYPTAPVGLICSSFRPSDDATLLSFLIPANLFAALSLRQIAELMEVGPGNTAFAHKCIRLAEEIESAVKAYGIHEHPTFGRIYAYEVDGYGGRVFMDDANVPSLLSLPYLGCCSSADPVYQATRAFALSSANPWWFRGDAAEGIGSPHTGLNRIWPLGIIMRGLTSTNDEEICECLRMLISTTAETGFMHEAFDKDDPGNFSRSWFAWANSLFGEWLLKLHAEKPKLLRQM